MKEAFSSFEQTGFPRFEETLRSALPELPKLEARVAQYMVLNTSDLSFETGASLAAKVGVSEVTVSRLLRRLGYAGMRGLKRELRAERSSNAPSVNGAPASPEVPTPFAEVMEHEIEALGDIFRQCGTPTWASLVRTIADADRVYVTGFQTVRGIAEDCARRLALARSDVRFLAVHDGMLTEWLEPHDRKRRTRNECLLLIDVVPYAREAPILAELCVRTNRSLIMITDEMCHWAKKHTDLIIHARTRSGLFLESTVAITAALNLLVHAIADEDSDALATRLDGWKASTRVLNLF